MVRNTLPLLLIIFLATSGAALSFNIDPAQVAESSVKDINYKQNVSSLQIVNASIENVGSIGCTYRLRAELRQGNETFERFSSPYPLWQGDFTRAEIKYIPINYTGAVEGNLSVGYCGEKEKVDNISFQVTENTLVDQDISSRTVEVNEDNAVVEVEQGDLLVPQKEPPYWKTSSTSIENGTAKIEYDAPIFDERETIKYTVLKNGEIRGSTKVEFQPEPTLKEKILDRKTELIALLLGLSAFFNLALLLERKGFITRIKDFEYDLPEFRKKD